MVPTGSSPVILVLVNYLVNYCESFNMSRALWLIVILHKSVIKDNWHSLFRVVLPLKNQ